jgi:hypothetical protein
MSLPSLLWIPNFPFNAAIHLLAATFLSNYTWDLLPTCGWKQKAGKSTIAILLFSGKIATMVSRMTPMQEGS